MSTEEIRLHENSRVVQPRYLEKSTSKKDLIRRLRNLWHVLQLEEPAVEPNSIEWPGLNEISDLLTNTKYLYHNDKEIRMYTILCCMEIFAIYAPDVPWDNEQVLEIFKQLTRQLGNIAHTYDINTSSTLRHYQVMLGLLANVRIGCVLVDMANNNNNDNNNDDDNENDSENDNSNNNVALEVFIEFIHTLLHSVRREHTSEILELVKQTIIVCLDEYSPTHGMNFPIAVLDELLLCIGQGRTMWIFVTPTDEQQDDKNNNKKNKKNKNKSKTAAVQQPQIEVPNPTYFTAAAVIQSLHNKIAQPISQLLNGLLTGDPYTINQSSLQCIINNENIDNNNDERITTTTTTKNKNDNENEVYNIIYELHHVTPQILTTVIGTVANGLTSTISKQRYQVVNLFGKLFSSTDTNFATEYMSCFRDWLTRQDDVENNIRIIVIEYCITILQQQVAISNSNNNNTEIQSSVTDALVHIITTDISVDVRLKAIHMICEWAYTTSCSTKNTTTTSSSATIITKLLHAVSTRIGSKHKQERRDAVTGLGRIYYKQYIVPHVKDINGNDDCDIDIILHILHTTCHFHTGIHTNSKRQQHQQQRRHHRSDNNKTMSDNWVVDDHNNNNVHDENDIYSWIPTKVLEGAYFTDETDPEMRSRVVHILDDILLGGNDKLTPTAKACGLTAIIDSLLLCGAENFFSTCHSIIDNQTNAFRFLHALLTQRAKLQETLSMYIDVRRELADYDEDTEEAIEADARANEILEMIAKLVPPDDQSKVSTEQIIQTLHDARDKQIFRLLSLIATPNHSTKSKIRALEELPRRTEYMGDAVSSWVKKLVNRCSMGESINSEVIHHCLLLAQECFQEGDVKACSALLASVKVVVEIFPSICSKAESFSTLTELFSECRSATGDIKKELNAKGILTGISSILSTVASSNSANTESNVLTQEENLKKQLIQLCTRDGTPEQAKNAMFTLVRLLMPEGRQSSDLYDEFEPILQVLTSASKLKISNEEPSSERLVSILSALSALAESAPSVICSERGQKAVTFCLESVLLGRDHEDPGSSSGDESEEIKSPRSARRSRLSSSAKKKSNVTPESKGSLLEDKTLSNSCRRLCAAIDFLIVYLRSTKLGNESETTDPQIKDKIALPAESRIKQIFQILQQILIDQGQPPCNRDRKYCISRQDRAALRQISAVSLLRLCDPRLQFEKPYFTPSMWHTLGGAFLDEESFVREAVMGEFSSFLECGGVFGQQKNTPPPAAPSLRIVSYIVLCTDGERDNDASNGSAANVGKVISLTHNAAHHCVVNLRKVSEEAYTKCCAKGAEAEKKFDNYFKVLLMPEYTLPYAFHLLSFRRETPSTGIAISTGGGKENQDSGDDPVIPDETQQRQLSKRLRALFEPIVHSLGETADNISFLLRMTEIINKHYQPVDFEKIDSHSPLRTSVGSEDNSIEKKKSKKREKRRKQFLEAKLKVVCCRAREVLLSFVKKDVNLTTYPGLIKLPVSLFLRNDVGTVKLTQGSTDQSPFRSPKARTPVSLLRSSARPKSTEHSKVHFSPDVINRPCTSQRDTTGSQSGNVSSKLILSNSPSSTESELKTLGTTPPAEIQTSTMHSPGTVPDVLPQTQSQSDHPSSKSSGASSATDNSLSQGILGSNSASASSSSRSSRKRRTNVFSPVSSQRKKKKSPGLPQQISVAKKQRSNSLASSTKSKTTKRKSRVAKKDELDFDDFSDTENQQNKESLSRKSSRRRTRNG